MAEVHGSPGDAPQMPAAMSPGPAPVPYAGAGLSPEPPGYSPAAMPLTDVAADIMAAYPAASIAGEQPWAHDPGAGPPDAPYYPGPVDPIYTGGDDDAGGRSPVAGAVGAAAVNAWARLGELQSDTYAQGSTIGDIVTLPVSPLDPGVGSLGTTSPSGKFYDPPRDYSTDPSGA